MKSEHRLVLTSPGTGFSDSFLVGNGHFGASVLFGPQRDEVGLSHIAFFSGREPEAQAQEGSAQAFRRACSLAQQGEWAAAAQAIGGMTGVKGQYGTNLPVGTLVIEQEDADGLQLMERTLNMEDGIASAAFAWGDGLQMRSAYAMEDPKVLVLHLSGSRSMRLRVRVEGECLQKVTSAFDRLFFEAQALETRHSDGKCGTHLLGILFAVSDGPVASEGRELIVEGGEVMLFLAMETDYAMDPGENPGRRRREILKKCADTEIEKAVHGYLGGRVREAGDGRSHVRVEGEDRLNRMLAMSEYLMRAASSDRAPLPMPLQGVWNDGEACALGWSQDFHLDVNTQMTYWCLEGLGMGDRLKPLFDFMRFRLIPQGRKAARDVYGLPGASAEISTNAFGYAAPYWDTPLAPCPACGWWLAQSLVRHARFRPSDREYLTGTALPLLAPYVDFALAYARTGGLCVSPENGFSAGGDTAFADRMPAFAAVQLRQLLRGWMELCDMAGSRDGRCAEAEEVLRGLPGIRINEEGEMAEYSHDLPTAYPGHRHMSHLCALYPFHEIVPEDGEAARAAEKTIRTRLAEGMESTPWSLAMLALYEARLGHGNEALSHLDRMLERHATVSLLLMHPALEATGNAREVFELDSHAGFLQAVLEMLVQGENGILLLLPALPDRWRAGRLRAVASGPYRVENMTWEDGFLSGALVHGTPGKIVRAREKDGIHEYRIPDEGILRLGREDGNE